MVHVDLTDDEALVLREVLESRWEELLKEIRHTDHREFRERLKARAESVEHVIAQLANVAAVH